MHKWTNWDAAEAGSAAEVAGAWLEALDYSIGAYKAACRHNGFKITGFKVHNTAHQRPSLLLDDPEWSAQSADHLNSLGVKVVFMWRRNMLRMLGTRA
jgi:hypothetical protein